MDAIREAASVALSLRKAAGLRVRLPLAELTIASNSDQLANYVDLIADELNVKKVSVVPANDSVAARFGLTKSLTVNARTLGPRMGGDVQRIIREAKAGNWVVTAGVVVVDGTELIDGEFELSMTAAAVSEDFRVGITSGGFVLLDTKVTQELEREGCARDAIRQIQQARKDAGLDVSDRISLALTADDESVVALEEHRDLISAEVLALELSIHAGSVDGVQIGESGSLGIELSKVG
jgi:isoleucyl-tRNA synthetase